MSIALPACVAGEPAFDEGRELKRRVELRATNAATPVPWFEGEAQRV